MDPNVCMSHRIVLEEICTRILCKSIARLGLGHLIGKWIYIPSPFQKKILPVYISDNISQTQNSTHIHMTHMQKTLLKFAGKGNEIMAKANTWDKI